jgi:nicotinamidase-related amidase
MQLKAKSTALVLIDLQKGVLATPVAPHSGAAIYECSMLLAQRFRDAGALVVRVRVCFKHILPRLARISSAEAVTLG